MSAHGIRIASLLAVLFTALPVVAQTPSPLWQGLEPGPYPVGWRTVTRIDDTRSFRCGASPVDGGRPIRLYVWYPAAASGAGPLLYSDYVAADSTPDEYERALQDRDLSTVHRQFAPVDSALTRELLDTPVHAYASPPPAPGRHPLVVHVLGRNDYQQEATVLWEYLASHGYVVVVPPQMGACPDSARLGFDPASIALQADDVDFALSTATSWPEVDPTRIAILGHSSGAVVALDVAADDPRVDAIVSLDGSIATAQGGALLREMGTEPVDVPVLDLEAVGNPDRDTSVLDSLARGDLSRWAFGTGESPRHATHFDFQNWPLFATFAGVEDERGAPFRTPEYGRDVWLAAVRVVRLFLDGVLEAQDGFPPAAWPLDPPPWLNEVARPIGP